MTREKVEVDENILKNIIVGDIPVFGRAQPINENTERLGRESVPVKNTGPVPATGPIEIRSEKTSPVKPRKKKDETGSYRDKYLVNTPASNRSHVYMNRGMTECIKHILPVIAPDMSISGYVSNILVDYIQQHWEEIGELYNKEYYKPLKPF